MTFFGGSRARAVGLDSCILLAPPFTELLSRTEPLSLDCPFNSLIKCFAPCPPQRSLPPSARSSCIWLLGLLTPASARTSRVYGRAPAPGFLPRIGCLVVCSACSRPLIVTMPGRLPLPPLPLVLPTSPITLILIARLLLLLLLCALCRHFQIAALLRSTNANS